MKRFLFSFSAILLFLICTCTFGAIARKALEPREAHQREGRPNPDSSSAIAGLPDYDIRADHRRSLDSLDDVLFPTGASKTTTSSPSIPGSSAAGRTLLRTNPRARVRWSSLTGTPSRIVGLDRSLSGPNQGAPDSVARHFLSDNVDTFGLRPQEIDRLRLIRQFRTEHNGVNHVFLQQAIGEIDVFQATMTVHLDRTGAVMSTGGELFRDLDRVDKASRPELPSEDALRLAATGAGATITEPIALTRGVSGASRTHAFSRQVGFARDVDVRLVYFPVSSTQLRLAWEFYLWMSQSPDAYRLVIDASNGVLLYRYNLTCYDENPLRPHGTVYPGESPKPHNPYTGIDSPPIVAQQDRPFRAEPFNGVTLFPVSNLHYDWWAGAPGNKLISNNTDTHLDRDAMPNQPDLPRLEAADGNFSFAVNLAASPNTDVNASAAQTNLFYWINRYHDIVYGFGFNEGAGNFQTDNFSLGGNGADAILGDAQDGSGFNNANFSTPSDGSPGRVQMFLWNSVEPNLDGDFDQGVIIHELTHGLSNRLVGNGSGLVGMQARGMGEGWSDYFGLVLLRQETDSLDGSYPVGQYVVNRYSRGIRRYPYSTSMVVNPLTLARISENTEVHAVGEIWCNVLWEMRKALIERYGFQEGQRQSVQLVVDGLKLTPFAPTFIDARDAILLADRVNNNGANLCLLGKAFAKRGMGFSAKTTDATDAAPIESFDEAPYCSDSGTLRLDRKNYLDNELVQINLGDRNGPTPSSVELRSTVTGDVETLSLIPEASVPGSFGASMRLTRGKAANGDGRLQCSSDAGDQIVVTYQDSSTSGGGSAQVIQTAGVAREAGIFADNIEQANQGWLASGTWGISTALSASATHSWFVRSSGNDVYLPSIALVSPLLDLSLFTDATLNFASSMDLFSGFNYGVIEYSTNDGATWNRTRAISGTRAAFDQFQTRLPGLDGQSRARIRFVLQNALTISTNYWAIDDISLTGRSGNPQAISPIVSNIPQIGSLAPAFGPPAGGTRVRITGANFTESEDTSIRFGGISATDIDVLGPTTLNATVPPHSLGAVTVSITNRYGTSALAFGFTFFQSTASSPAPTLTEVFPGGGSNRGGTTVTVVGGGFTPETVVSFGAFAAQSTFVNGNTLRVSSPATQNTGPVNVQVRNGAQQATLTGGFIYTSPTPPQIQLLSPNGGETLFSGSTVNLSWRSSDNRSVARHRVFMTYMLGQLSFQFEIAAEVAGGIQSFNWQIPLNQPPTTQARLHVIATDDEGAQTESVSAADFSLAQRWERISALPLALIRTQSIADSKFVYVMGGRLSTVNSSTIAAVSRYDAETNVWTSQGLQPMVVGLNGGDAALIDGKIFVPGGFNVANLSSLHYAYDIATNIWTQRAEPPVALFLYSVAVEEGRKVFHLTGGNNNITGGVSTARTYDPAANTWTELPAMSTARYGHKSTIIEGKLLVAGGVGAAGGLTSCESFDLVTRLWSPIASLNTPRSGAASFITRDPIGNPLWFLVGGLNPNTNLPLGAEVYDIRNNRWISLDGSYNLIIPRAFPGSATLGNFFYTLAGGTPTSPSATNERVRLETLAPVSANRPPVLVAPESVVGIPGDELKVNLTASDLGGISPVGIVATGLPTGAVLSTFIATNNSTRGLITWTPSEADRGKTFAISVTASDGQFSETRQILLSVVSAAPMAAVNAADFRAGPLAPDSVVAAFGAQLAVRTEVAQVIPLPFTLAGTSAFVNGLPVQLFFVSRGQINFAMPSGIESGPATILVISANGAYSVARVMIERAAPAIFTANSAGTGEAAALATADGITYQNPPFDVVVNGRPNILVLFGTGFRRAQAANPNDDNGVAESVQATIDGRTAVVHYTGAQGIFSGLDQLNIEIPQSLTGGPQRLVEVAISVNGINANRVLVQIK